MTSSFDPSLFLDASTTEAASRRPPLAAGADFVGIIGEPKVRQSQGKKDPTQTYTFVDFPIALDTSTVEGQPPTVTLTHGVSLQLTDGGMIDWSPGKNGGMRAMREALGMNVPGQTFNIRAMQGHTIRVKVKHETYEGETYDRVDSVAKA